MFVYYRGGTFKAGWGTSQVSLVIIKSAKKNTQSNHGGEKSNIFVSLSLLRSFNK